MKKLNEIVGITEEPHLIIQEYHKTLDEWCEDMVLPDATKQSVISSQLVLLPWGYRESPKAFTSYTIDFYNYCKRNGMNIEICCNDEDFSQLELCSVKVRLGRILAPSAISGVLIWNIVSGYIKEAIYGEMNFETNNKISYEYIHYLRNHLRDSYGPGTCLFQDCGQVQHHRQAE